jgi:hypothetical protein
MVEVLVVITALLIIAAVLLPALAVAKRRTSKLGCVSCLKQIGLAYRVWEGDNGDKYPMQVSVTNGGAMELIATGNVAAVFEVMSNELTTPKLLICPEDAHRVRATNFSVGFNNSHISYFVGLDASTNFPQSFLSGDDNFAINGSPAKSGLLELSTNVSADWTEARHKYQTGNIGFEDGSVQGTYYYSLRVYLHQTGVATNRLALP